MGKRSRDKGRRNEQALVNDLKAVGLNAYRVPLSGAAARADGEYAGDLKVNGEVFEAKVRSRGFTQIYEWLGANKGLFIKADRHETLVVLRLGDWLELMIKGGSATAPSGRSLNGGTDGTDADRTPSSAKP
jgi:hypothetical protein